MRHLKYLLFLALFLVPAPLLAADLNYDADTYLELTSPAMTLTIVSGATADSITVNAGTVEITMSAGQSLILRSAAGYDLSNNTLSLPNTCYNTTQSQITLTVASTQTITVTPNPTVICTSPPPSGGSPGSGPSGSSDTTAPNAPTNVAVADPKTGTSLTLSWTKPTASDFAYVRIYRSTATGALGSLLPSAQTGVSYSDTGLVTGQSYYYTLRSVDTSGNESANSNQVNGAPTKQAGPASQEITATVGGKVELSDKSAAMNIPAGATTGTLTASITPSASYTVPATNYGVVGNQVYDIQVKTGDTAVTDFTKALTLTFSYTDSQIAGLDESSLKIQYWDNVQKKWLAVTSSLDKTTNTLTATVNHLTVFAIIGKKTTAIGAGSLVKLTCAAKASVNDPCRSVYYLASDGGRYVFPNEKTYNAWYADFSQVKEITAEALASYPIKGNVTIRPGTYLVKITTDPKVYAVEAGGNLRWVASEALAKKLWGDNWAKKVVDVPDAFFVNYKTANAVTNKLTTSYPNGSLVKYVGASSIYYIENDQKRVFKNTTALTNNGLRDEFIVTAPADLTFTNGSEVTDTETKLKNTAGPNS